MLNQLHPSIKFTQETSRTSLPFLDITVNLKDGQVTTDIYYKNTDTHQYLNFKSCHPSHTKRNIPYCLARKICTVIEDKSLREERLDELKNFLILQKYPLTLIQNGIDRAKQIPIQTLRATRHGESECTNEIVPFVTTHNPARQKIKESNCSKYRYPK